MLIDTHAHLFAEEFTKDLDKCLINAKNNNVNKIVLVGFSLKTNLRVLELSKEFDIFYPSCGLHPSEASSSNQENLFKLEQTIKNNPIYAIGECGLDYYWVKDNKDLQKELFEEQIKLAIKYELPLIIHMRDATEDTYNILLNYKGLIKGVMHCYSGSYEMAIKFIALGFYISIGGPVTFKNAKEPKIVAKEIPLDRLLIETDCPYLAPSPYRGGRNESSFVKLVALEIAKIRNLSFEEIALVTTNNAIKIFNL